MSVNPTNPTSSQVNLSAQSSPITITWGGRKYSIEYIVNGQAEQDPSKLKQVAEEIENLLNNTLTDKDFGSFRPSQVESLSLKLDDGSIPNTSHVTDVTYKYLDKDRAEKEERLNPLLLDKIRGFSLNFFKTIAPSSSPRPEEARSTNDESPPSPIPPAEEARGEEEETPLISPQGKNTLPLENDHRPPTPAAEDTAEEDTDSDQISPPAPETPTALQEEVEATEGAKSQEEEPLFEVDEEKWNQQHIPNTTSEEETAPLLIPSNPDDDIEELSSSEEIENAKKTYYKKLDAEAQKRLEKATKTEAKQSSDSHDIGVFNRLLLSFKGFFRKGK